MKRIKAKCTDCEAECIVEFNDIIDPDDGETNFQPEMCVMYTGQPACWRKCDE